LGIPGGSLLRVSLAVVLGALNDFHASMAVETPLFLYIGIGFLIIGNGLFKPNMTSIISNAYNHPEKKTVLIQCTIWV
jgi:POT family proton-dependent oligopeptide transporter